MRRIAKVVSLLLLALGVVLAVPAPLAAQPNRPEPQALTLDPASTALLVLDLNARCDEPTQACYPLVEVISEFLPKSRANRLLTVYTGFGEGTPQGKLAVGFEPRSSDELLIYPDGNDKFFGGELDGLLKDKGIKTVIVTGASTNSTVLYTASSAGRNYGYDVVVPLDGTVAANTYEYEYTIHQFTVVFGIREKIRFTTLDMISFARP